MDLRMAFGRLNGRQRARPLDHGLGTGELIAPAGFDRLLAALAYHDRDVEEELGVFDLTRRQIGRILRASPPEAWERTGVVGDRGIGRWTR